MSDKCRLVYVSKGGDRYVGCGLVSMPEQDVRTLIARFHPFAERIGGKFECEDMDNDGVDKKSKAA